MLPLLIVRLVLAKALKRGRLLEAVRFRVALAKGEASLILFSLRSTCATQPSYFGARSGCLARISRRSLKAFCWSRGDAGDLVLASSE